MQDWLEPFRDKMEKIDQQEYDQHDSRNEHNSGDPKDTIGRSSLLWCVIYSIVKEYQQRFSSIKLIRHEDLSSDPYQGFQTLYTELSLDYRLSVQRAITNASSSENPKELSKHRKHSVRLDSRSNLDNWKHRLSREEIHRIRSLTEDVAAFYYPDSSWE
jgi:hypothetical protein